jgi:hypothetical protein
MRQGVARRPAQPPRRTAIGPPAATSRKKYRRAALCDTTVKKHSRHTHGQRWTLRPMQAIDVQRRHATDEGRRSAWLSMLVLTGLLAHAEPGVSQSVGPQQQAARDHDRIEILREELRKSEAQLEGLERRKAERLAASDPKAAAELEEQRVRTLGDVAAIRREIASSHPAHRTAAARPMVAQSARRASDAGRREATGPWWDVYGSRRAAPSAALSHLPAPAQMPAGSPTRPTGVKP